MSLERKRGISTAQVKLRMLNLSVVDTATTPAAASFDRFQIASITDVGVGNYTIIFAKPFERDCIVVGHSLVGAGILTVTAVAYDRVTVQVDSDFIATAADIDFSICICGSDSRFDY